MSMDILWVYLRNVTNAYMPRDQHFKYEVRVNSVARVDVYWKDIGRGSINYFYWYVDLSKIAIQFVIIAYFIFKQKEMNH